MFSLEGAQESPLSDFLLRVMYSYEIFILRELVLDNYNANLVNVKKMTEKARTAIVNKPLDPALHIPLNLGLKTLFEKYLTLNPEEEFDFENFEESVQSGTYENGKCVLQVLTDLNIPSNFITSLSGQLKKCKHANRLCLKLYPSKMKIGSKNLVLYLRERDHVHKR